MEENSHQRSSLLIVKSHAQGLGAAETFLKNRGWDIKATENLKDALDFLVQHQPQFVMISIDHPNRKVRHLPKVLAEAFPVCVIAFSETASAANIKILTDTSAEYAIFPPVTGPAIERTVAKYHKDMQVKDPSAMNKDSTWGLETDGKKIFSIKGSSSMEAAQELLNKFLTEDQDTSNPVANNDEPKPLQYSSYQNKNASSGWAPLPNKENPHHQPGLEVFDQDEACGPDSLISQGAQEALEKACVNFQEVVHKFDKTTQIACVLIESSRFSGYLIAAMAKNNPMDLELMERVRSRLFHFLNQNGEVVEDKKSISVKITEVPFEEWALSHADFLQKSVHHGEEVAMAFFPRKDLKIQFSEFEDMDMAALNINELSADEPLDFNLYIHLPRNDKYLLYTPYGGTFFANQKERLTNLGISHLHILRLEMQSLDTYRAQKFLNSKIQEFEQQENEKALV